MHYFLQDQKKTEKENGKSNSPSKEEKDEVTLCPTLFIIKRSGRLIYFLKKNCVKISRKFAQNFRKSHYIRLCRIKIFSKNFTKFFQKFSEIILCIFIRTTCQKRRPMLRRPSKKNHRLRMMKMIQNLLSRKSLTM